MVTTLYADSIEGTHIVYDDRADEVRVTVHVPPFSKRTMQLDATDADRLLAVVEHAHDPIDDLAEFFADVFHVPHSAAMRAGRAFDAVAASIADCI